MRLINKIFISFSITILLFILTICEYNIECMGEIEEGRGHFFVWLIKGFSSLSYQIDLIKFIFDFSMFFTIIFLLVYFIKESFSRWLSILLYSISILLFLMLIPSILIGEIYFDKIDCKTIFSSISFGWY